MINNQKCVECSIFDICKAAQKLKAFTDESRVDLGVTLDFKGCTNFRQEEDNGKEVETDTEEN